jgi:hypothetical protein
LVQARDELAAWGRAGYFPLDGEGAAGLARPAFPTHTHLGGLYLFTGPKLPAVFDAWVRATVTRFADFYAHCPAEWLVVEDPELLRRLRRFQGLVYA